MEYRRFSLAGATYFFTVVTFERQPLFADADNLALLRQAFKTVKARHPFVIDALVLLPDHLHCLWTLPEGDDDFSSRWMSIKREFTRPPRQARAGGMATPLLGTLHPRRSRFSTALRLHPLEPG